MKLDPIYEKLFEIRPRKGDLRKLEIVLTAIRVLCKNGLDNFTLDSVAKELRIRRSHVAYYFKNKDELLDQVVKLVIATGQDITVESLKKAKAPKDLLKCYVEGTFLWFEKYPEHAVIMGLLYHLAAYDKRFRMLNTSIRKAARERLSGLFEQLPKFKKLSKKKKELSVLEAHNVITGCLITYFSEDYPLEYKQATQACLNSLSNLSRQWI